MEFYQPTKTHKEMLVLDHIHENEKVTQKKLARLTNASSAMINQYIDELDDNNYITRKYISAKVVRYYVTDKGYKYRNYLKIKLIKELMDLYMTGQSIVSNFLESIENNNFKKIILYGAGEVADIFIDMISKHKLNLRVMALIDDDENKIGQQINNIPVISLNDINAIDHDGLIITSYTFEAKILEKLNIINYPNDKIVKYFEREMDRNVLEN